MAASLLIVSIILYILSLAASLIIAIASKKFNPHSFPYPAYLHLFFLAAGIISYMAGLKELTSYSILLSVCSALWIAGWGLRNKFIRWPIRIYFSLYLLSILLFLASPSLLIYTITGKLSERSAEKWISMGNNYYLVEQSGMQPARELHWKMIRKSGPYKKTIQRDLSFGYIPDSVRIVGMEEDTVILCGYKKTSSGFDSTRYGFRPIHSELIQQKH